MVNAVDYLETKLVQPEIKNMT